MIIEMLVLGIPISLGYGVLGWIQPLGMTLLDFFDFVTNSCMMPISALCTVLLIIFVTKLKTISNEIKISSAFKREKVYNIVMKYICIPTLLIILLSYILSTIWNLLRLLKKAFLSFFSFGHKKDIFYVYNILEIK